MKQRALIGEILGGFAVLLLYILAEGFQLPQGEAALGLGFIVLVGVLVGAALLAFAGSFFQH